MIGDIVKLLEGLPEPLLAIIHRVISAVVNGSGNPYSAAAEAERAALAAGADAAADLAAEKIEGA